MISPDQVYDRGSDATLICEAVEGLNDSDVQWWRGGEVVIGELGKLEVHEIEGVMSNLTIKNLTVADGGEYTCQVSAADGASSVTVSISISPYFTVRPKDVAGDNATTVAMNCEAEAYPEPVYQWTRENGEAVRGYVSGVLEFSPVQFEDQGTYICSVTAGDITIESNATLTGSYNCDIMKTGVHFLFSFSQRWCADTFCWTARCEHNSVFALHLQRRTK